MNPYTSERWILESHQAVVREAERRARLLPESERSAGFNTWIAGRLRGLADRLDGRASFEKATQ
jgi:RecB family exonuclease